MKGYMGFEGILGHEFVGVVVEAPPDKREQWLGKRVCADINVACNNQGVIKCAVCVLNVTDNPDERWNRLRRNHCPNRTVMGILGRSGCFAQYLCLPCRNLHPVPDNVSDADACFAEPLGAALRIVEQRLIVSQSKVAVLGDGKLGLLIAAAIGTTVEAAEHEKKELVLFGRHKSKLDMLKGLSIITPVDVSTEEGKARLESASGTFDVAVDATGSPDGFEQACRLLKPRGTCVLKSTCAADKGINLAPIVIDELQIIGSRCGPIDEALKVMGTSKHRLPLAEMIDAVYPLEKIEEAFKRAAQRGTLKVVVEM